VERSATDVDADADADADDFLSTKKKQVFEIFKVQRERM
jgi:hypothetical protein